MRAAIPLQHTVVEALTPRLSRVTPMPRIASEQVRQRPARHSNVTSSAPWSTGAPPVAASARRSPEAMNDESRRRCNEPQRSAGDRGLCRGEPRLGLDAAQYCRTSALSLSV
jgi:hypothetical protein